MNTIPDNIMEAYNRGANACRNYYDTKDKDYLVNPYNSREEYQGDTWFAWANGWNYFQQFLNLCVPHMSFNKKD